MGLRADQRRARRAIIDAWQDAGRPPCAICGTAIAEGDAFRVSGLWQAVVHPFCVQARVMRPAQVDLDRGACAFHPDRCPIPFRDRGCVCPAVAACNEIIVARRRGLPTVDVATRTTWAETGHLPVLRSGVAELARQAGLGTTYRDVPPRENPDLDVLRQRGVPAPGVDLDAFLDEPATWHFPPDRVTIDVDRTIREGRMVLAQATGDT